MSIRCTSIAAYRALQDSGKGATQKARIIAIVADRENTSLREIQRAFQIRYGIRMDIGTISARCKALKDEKVLVEEVLPRKCTISDVTVNPVRINPDQIQDEAG